MVVQAAIATPTSALQRPLDALPSFVRCRDELVGVVSILRYIGRAAASKEPLYGADPLSACQVRFRSLRRLFWAASPHTRPSRTHQPRPPGTVARPARAFADLSMPSFLPLSLRPQVDQWLDISQTLVPGAGFEGVATALNDFLSLRTFLVGYALTLADVACWAQLQLTLQWDRLRKAGGLTHLARWCAGGMLRVLAARWLAGVPLRQLQFVGQRRSNGPSALRARPADRQVFSAGRPAASLA